MHTYKDKAKVSKVHIEVHHKARTKLENPVHNGSRYNNNNNETRVSTYSFLKLYIRQTKVIP